MFNLEIHLYIHIRFIIERCDVCRESHMYLQSTLALRTPRYYGHPANAEKSQPPSTPPAKRIKK